MNEFLFILLNIQYFTDDNINSWRNQIVFRFCPFLLYFSYCYQWMSCFTIISLFISYSIEFIAQEKHELYTN
jgi:hypothetical protein